VDLGRGGRVAPRDMQRALRRRTDLVAEQIHPRVVGDVEAACEVEGEGNRDNLDVRALDVGAGLDVRHQVVPGRRHRPLPGEHVPGPLRELLDLAPEAEGVADRSPEPDLHGCSVLLDDPLAHVRAFDAYLHSSFVQHLGTADARPLEDHRRLDRPGGEDDVLAGGVRDPAAVLARGHSNDARAFELQGIDGRFGDDGQVLPTPDRPQERVRRALAQAVLDRRRRKADVLRILGVDVFGELPPRACADASSRATVSSSVRSWTVTPSGPPLPRTGDGPSEWSSIARYARRN
jgi:hypothetical protein